jgi:asparagine synthase (glutamine-hydrolysing)
MCGIFGSINIDITDSKDAILNSLLKRGPDGNGIFHDENYNTTLIHTRLSIIDTSKTASQPMVYNNYIITFNGEIYNYKEIRNELITLGYQFNTNSDTEVVLLAYDAWKEVCLTKFRGMFAFGIWNKITNTLFAARDHFGIKPFYFFHQNNGLIFASLLQTLLATGIPNKKINLKGVAIYLQTGSFTGDETIIENIIQLPPAHYLYFENGAISINKYWNIVDDSTTFEKPRKYEDAVSTVRHKLEDSAQYQLVSDVPVGAFLSSGVDSCIAVGLMSKFSSNRISTFTLGFERQYSSLNELDGAKLISKKFNTNHQEFIVNDNYINNIIDEYIDDIDQPSIDGLNTYLISKETAKYCKVAVSGLGSDELYCGYSHFVYAAAANNSFKLGFNSLSKLPKSIKIIPEKFRELMQYSLSNIANRHQMIRNYGTQHQFFNKLKNIDKNLNNKILENYYSELDNKGIDPVQELTLWEINRYLSNTLLRDGDALSMSHALEVRPMFLDHKLASYFFGLNADFKVNYKRKKKLLVDACIDLIPPEIFYKKKTGFELPLKFWLQSNFKNEYLDLLKSAVTFDLFSKEYIKFLKNNIIEGKVNNIDWAIFILIKFIQKNSLHI